MDDGFYQAFLSGDSKIAGRKLKPFSLWHQFLLSALESPVVGDLDRIKTEDILISIRICQTDFPNSPIVKLTILDAIRLFFINRKPERVADIALKFGNYLKENTSSPEFWERTDGDYKPFTAPACLSSVGLLISKGFSEEEAWNMPIGKSKWYEATFSERSGGDLKFCYEGDKENTLENMTKEEHRASIIEALGEEEGLKFIKQEEEENNARV